MAAKIGILVGSARVNSNGAGIAAFVKQRLDSVIAASNNASTETVLINPATEAYSWLPTGPFTHDYIPQGFKDPSSYPDEQVQRWSALVSSLSAMIIVSPQYNWSLPGHLKNLIDQLFNEYSNKPFVIVTYGGHGGSKAGMAWKSVIEGIRAHLVSQGELEYHLPAENIRGSARASPEDAASLRFLAQYEGKTDEVLTRLMGEIESRPVKAAE